MAIEHIRLSKKAKDQLIRLKSVTGIQQWNILCRWAFCLSLAEKTAPASIKIVADSNVEMTWKVFGGEYADIYYALLIERCLQDGVVVNDVTLAEHFKLHLHRGISYLAGNKKIKCIADFIRLAA
jgi:DNA sulfur modification protein DndE